MLLRRAFASLSPPALRLRSPHSHARTTHPQAHSSPDAVRSAFVGAFAEAVNAAITERGYASVALTAGSALEVLDALSSANVAWSNVHIFWADELCCSPGNGTSNAEQAASALSQAGVPQANIHSVNSSAGPDTAAAIYEVELRGQPVEVLPHDDDGVPLSAIWPRASQQECSALKHERARAGMPVFDLIVLGLGRDGSVASLWPNSKQIAEERSIVVAVDNAPEEPKQRVTMTMKAINAARRIVLPVMGSNRAELVQRVLEVQALPGAQPAQMLSPKESALWQLDSEAGAALTMERWGDKKAFPRNHPPEQGGEKEEAPGETSEAEQG